jgi:hypothetical protein
VINRYFVEIEEYTPDGNFVETEDIVDALIRIQESDKEDINHLIDKLINELS